MYLQKTEIKSFQIKILNWYKKHGRDLPWRKTREPYPILVSEVMLQQTQVARVMSKYEEWMKTLPTVQHLAKAPLRQILRLWLGLGYNRRALYLQKTAQTIVRQYNGEFPTAIEELEKLPGIGKYTAAAIACFAFDQQIAVVDTNIRKVILLQFFTGKDVAQKVIGVVAYQLLPKGRAYEWNQALMDYSSAMLKKEKIPIPKQSRFRGSRRFYRGQILKLLLKKHRLKKEELASHIPTPDLPGILADLLQEKMIRKKRQSFFLPED